MNSLQPINCLQWLPQPVWIPTVRGRI